MVMPDAAAEGVLIIGAGRAILLQIAEPAVGHGVAAHSDFRSRPLDRFHATLTYVYAVAFGTPEEIAFVRRRVNRAHGPVHNAPDHSPAYNAFDSGLQLWVAATLYDSAMLVYEHVLGAPDAALADRLYAEYADLGTALQMPTSLWPSDRAAFADYWAHRLTVLRTDAATRDVAQQLLHPRAVPISIRAVMPLARLMTAGLLPTPVRELFDLPWTPRRQHRFDMVLRVIAALYPRLPRVLRHWPRHHYLAVLRRQMREAVDGTRVRS